MATTAILVPTARRGGLAAYIVHFRWLANPEADVTGYKLYPTRISGDYNGPSTDMGNATTGSYSIARPAGNGVWYFALTAYSSAGLQSVHSSEVSITIA
jgi:hypothetical protein